MCGHMMFIAPPSSLQQRHLWRCSACGRASQSPLDCCARPDYAPQPSTGLIRTGWRWVGMLGSALYTGLGTLWARYRDAHGQHNASDEKPVYSHTKQAEPVITRASEGAENEAQEIDHTLVEV